MIWEIELPAERVARTPWSNPSHLSHAFRKLHSIGVSSTKHGVISFLDWISNRSCGDLLAGNTALTEVVLLSSEHCSHVLHAAGTGSPSPLSLGGVVVSTELATAGLSETGTGTTLLLSVPILSTCYSGKSMWLSSAATLSGGSSCLNENNDNVRDIRDVTVDNLPLLV